MENISPKLILIVALAIEAKALRGQAHWAKIHLPLKGCAGYYRHDKNILLVVSGAGKLASALATSAVCQEFVTATHKPIVVNIGVAGKAQAQFGALYWIHKVTDHGMQKETFPQCQLRHPLATGAVITFDTPQTCYPQHDLVDMEASGFIFAALKWVSVEYVAVIKCVCDCADHSVATVTKDTILQILQANLVTLEQTYDALLKYQQKIVGHPMLPIDVTQWLQHWHFTVTQQHQLKKMLQDLSVLNRDFSVEQAFADCSAYNNAKQVLQFIKTMHQQRSGMLYGN